MPKQHHKDGGRGAVRRWVGIFLAAGLLLALGVQSAQAFAYYFSVPTNTVDVFVNADGTVTIDYYYVFQNQPSGEPIQYVDIGMPTTDYDMSSITGTLNNQPVGVEKSTEVKGIALNLGGRAIPPSQSGEVRAHIATIHRMLFKADQAKTQKQEAYGSLQFEPNFFGSQYVTGRTDMTITLHLPPGMNQDEPIYFPPQNWPGQEQPDESGFDANGAVYYRWHAPNADISEHYTFGAAFPARLVPADALLTPLPQVNINFDTLCPWIFCLGFVGFIGITIYGSVVGDRKRRLQYLPPRVAVEGNGVKRGLTAVEAAILMQQPMDKILTMILFSVIKKGAARVVTQNPLKIEALQPVPEDLRAYETDFLAAMARPDRAGQRRGLQDMMTNLVKGVSEKMRGFSRKETVDYYQQIMSKAWQQVEAANTPEMKMQAFDEAMDWTMLDRNFNDRTRNVFGPRPVFVPYWWGNYDPSFGRPSGTFGQGGAPSTPSVSSAGNQVPQGVSLPNLPGADFAGSLVAGMQNFSSNVVGDLTAFTGGVTNQTNPVPKPPPSTRSGGGGGGGGRSCACACACACAGCACACAGGGR